MAGVLANYENLAMATNDLAFVAHLLYRRTYLHNCFLSVSLLVSAYLSRPAAADDSCVGWSDADGCAFH